MSKLLKKAYVVGIGPGGGAEMTARARAALEEADVLLGYTVYLDLIQPDFPEKKRVSTPMRGERERCALAVKAALSGETPALVCSGDAGVYGMAGLLLETAADTGVAVEVVPGVTAACSGGALLGAPLGHDFAVVSLSDLLTPWEVIERRLLAAAQGDFALCLYNPMSRSRPDSLRRACDILLRALPPERPCGLAVNIGREGECARLLTLGRLRDTQADMFTTIFVGSSSTFVLGEALVTPRGYRSREAAGEALCGC